MDFFSQSVDQWGAPEWFDRMAKALRQQNEAVVAGDQMKFETCKNVAASSAHRLVSDFEDQVRTALRGQANTWKEHEGRSKAALAYLIEHATYGNSYGVIGSDFECCHFCNAGGAPGVAFEHDKTCPVLKCETIAEEWWSERKELLSERDAAIRHVEELKDRIALLEGTATPPESLYGEHTHITVGSCTEVESTLHKWLGDYMESVPPLGKISKALTLSVLEHQASRQLSSGAARKIANALNHARNHFEVVTSRLIDNEEPGSELTEARIGEQMMVLALEALKEDQGLPPPDYDVLIRSCLAEASYLARLHSHHSLWRGIIEPGWDERIGAFGILLARRISDEVARIDRASIFKRAHDVVEADARQRGFASLPSPGDRLVDRSVITAPEAIAVRPAKTVVNNWTGGATLQTWPEGDTVIVYARDAAGTAVQLSLQDWEAKRLAWGVSTFPLQLHEQARAANQALFELSYPDARADELRQIADEIDCGGGCDGCGPAKLDRGEFCSFVAATSLRDLAAALDLKASIAQSTPPAPPTDAAITKIVGGLG
ncbi:hypothetical protein OOZ54_12515 [Rhodopseudomonas palustris]|uniref:hypothetical protein n=1 Tax=Rhodopseudomonas palustris TaxID=1076 RepID=UPI0022F0B542|nr:hypothetical protein [Rhodopseudomonas palustris]WBU27517.1 hypothetical protein OOZ54_12515 [Rhodopseudomonas palustris]